MAPSMTMLSAWLTMLWPPRMYRTLITIPKTATATPSGHAHGCNVQKPYAAAISRPA